MDREFLIGAATIAPLARRMLLSLSLTFDRGVVAGVVLMALSAAGCSGSSPTAPSSSAVVTFSVATESFQVLLRNADQVTAARVAQSGGRATIPIGRIASGTEINTGWSWHLEDVTFAEVATEVCDGRPSDVERQGAGFGGGRFCPWTAKILRIEYR